VPRPSLTCVISATSSGLTRCTFERACGPRKRRLRGGARVSTGLNKRVRLRKDFRHVHSRAETSGLRKSFERKLAARETAAAGRFERELDLWGLNLGSERAFIRARLSDFSLRCFEEPIRLPTNSAAKLQRTYIVCLGGSYLVRPVVKNIGDWAKQEGWTYHELPGGPFFATSRCSTLS
jgi:hypothetical protein